MFIAQLEPNLSSNYNRLNALQWCKDTLGEGNYYEGQEDEENPIKNLFEDKPWIWSFQSKDRNKPKLKIYFLNKTDCVKFSLIFGHLIVGLKFYD